MNEAAPKRSKIALSAGSETFSPRIMSINDWVVRLALLLAAAGFAVIRRNRNLLLVAGLMAAQTVVAGASLVYEVSIALDLLEMGESGLGLLDAVLGVGGIIGGFVVLVLARRGRLASDMISPAFSRSSCATSRTIFRSILGVSAYAMQKPRSSTSRRSVRGVPPGGSS